jgi:hypothetical protein
MTALDREREKLKQIERQDLPAFDRWVAANYGPLQTELRELGVTIAEKAGLVAEIEDEVFFGNCRSYHAAWKRVTERRTAIANGTGAASPEDDDDDDDPFASFDPFGFGRKDGARFPGQTEDPDSNSPTDREAEELFRDFIFEFGGIDPDSLDPREYARMLGDFKATMLGMGASGHPRSGGSSRSARPDLDPKPNPARTRLKELYRTLVRRLHPDVRADGDPNVTAVWHEVQVAYAAGDEARLETLLAFTDVRENRAGSHTTLSQWRAVIAELKAAINAVRRSLRLARRDRAWNFVRAENRTALEAKVSSELTRALARKRAERTELEHLLDLWSKPPVSRRRPAPAKTNRQSVRQSEFQF